MVSKKRQKARGKAPARAGKGQPGGLPPADGHLPRPGQQVQQQGIVGSFLTWFSSSLVNHICCSLAVMGGLAEAWLLHFPCCFSHLRFRIP